jgi:hypothetical protein
MRGHVTLCYMVVGGNLHSPLNLFISFAKALMEQGFPSDPFLAKDRVRSVSSCWLKSYVSFFNTCASLPDGYSYLAL